MGFFEENDRQIRSFINNFPDQYFRQATLSTDYLDSILSVDKNYDQSAKLTIAWRGNEFLNILSQKPDAQNISTFLKFMALVANERMMRDQQYTIGAEHEFIEMYDEFSANSSTADVQDVSRVIRTMLLSIAREAYNATRTKEENLSAVIEEEKSNISDWIEKNLLNTQGSANKLIKEVSGWKEYLESHENKLKNIKSNYNFVGLSKGFHDIEKSKRKSRFWLLVTTVSMGLITVAVPIAVAANNILSTAQPTWPTSLENTLPLLPLILPIEIILIYYFRILLKNFQSMSAQIVQLELRQALCAFIESYVEYKKDLSDNVSVSKFEDMVFSGIATDPEQIPQTFDGLEKLASALNALKKAG